MLHPFVRRGRRVRFKHSSLIGPAHFLVGTAPDAVPRIFGSRVEPRQSRRVGLVWGPSHPGVAKGGEKWVAPGPGLPGGVTTASGPSRRRAGLARCGTRRASEGPG